MVARAGAVARERDVGRGPRAIAGRIGRTVDPDDRRAQRRGQVQRSGIPGDDETSRADDRQELAERGRGSDGRRTVGRGDDRTRQVVFARPPGHHGRPPVARPQMAGDGAEAFGRPALVRPRGAGVDQRERLPCREPEHGPDAGDDVRRGRLQREPRRTGLGADCLGKRQRVVDDVRPCRLDPRVVGPARERLAQVLAGQSDDVSCASQVGQRRRLQQPLRIDRDVVAHGAQGPDDRDDAGRAPQAPGIDGDDRREAAEVVEDGAVLHVDEPVDARIRPGRTKRGGERQGVDDVAERAEPDDQEGSPPPVPVRVALWRGLVHGVSPRTAATRSFVE